MITNHSEAASPLSAELLQRLLSPVSAWYESKRKLNGKVETNVMCAGIYVGEYLSSGVPITDALYRTDKESQVKGAGGPAMKRILAAHGEARAFLAEGGRTSRGTLPLVVSLADVINREFEAFGIERVGDEDRRAVAWGLQEWFVEKIRVDFFDTERLDVDLDPGLPVAAAVSAILDAGVRRGGNTAGAVAEHLVAVKLQLRFPEAPIRLKSYTTADKQSDEAGDFQVGDTAIHVTMSPSPALFDVRCRKNLKDGFRPRVLVPSDNVAAAVQLSRLADLGEQVAVQSIEDFVGTNIEELGEFTVQGVRSGLRALLEGYNDRIGTAEVDQSLRINIPKNL
jgi:hypothetical protein